MSSKKGNKKQKKVVGGYYKKEVDSITKDNKIQVEESSDDEQETLPNFDYLASIPVSTQSHFILKSEQEKFQGESIVNYSKYFKINVNLLNASIKSLPFNELHVIKGIEWSEEELKDMQEIAQYNENQYKELLNKNTEAIKVPKPEKELGQKVEKLKISQKATESKEVAVESNSKASMEKWLDDILDI
ncbi:hypothetical protein PVAND_009897 [Polypedilum vanderplanki]|uniref:Uncharacterized protein n=1 Tax=Polypedilum vanderplanki TaxID=319348 RepID=A0A9J6CE74_POLVA|nr:hypothetical protein PVAND_009897 [Polypedilum vanderplanki]